MAFERIGIGGILTFNQSQFVTGVAGARNELGQFVKSADQVPGTMGRMAASVTNAAKKIGASTKQIGAGIKQMGAGMAQAALGMAPLTAGVAAGVVVAATFEKKMGGVAAITRASASEMETLTDLAKKMGIESVFSATQSAEAMEFMGRASATTEQIVSGLPGVMSAAAAESIDLATASDLVAQATKIMGRSWDEAANTADILALTSAKTNTDMISLGEALKTGGQSARNMGFDLAETSATLGMLADAGLRGSIGGTALTNMFDKMAKPSGKASKLMKQWNIELTDGKGKMKSMANITGQFAAKVDKISDPIERQGVVTELFGKRGAKAFLALSSAGEDAQVALVKAMRSASDGIGAAQMAAEKRLDNFAGAFTLFKSSIESVAIGIFGPLLESFQGTTEDITSGLNSVLFALSDIDKVWGDLGATVEDVQEIEGKHGKTAVQFALGIKDAIETVKEAWSTVTTFIKAAGNVMNDTFGSGSARKIAKIAVLVIGVAAVAAPVILAMVTLGFAISGVVTFFAGLATVASGVFGVISGAVGLVTAVLSGPLVLVLGIVALAFAAIRREGESVGETLSRVWGNIAAGAIMLWESVLQPFIAGFMSQWGVAMESISAIWNETFGSVMAVVRFAIDEIKMVFAEMFGAWGNGTSLAKSDWVSFGEVAMAVVSAAVATVVQMLGFVIKAATFVAVGLFKILAWPFQLWEEFVQGVLNTVLSFMEDGFVSGILNIVKVLLNAISAPFRLIMEMAAAAIDLIPGVDLPPELKNFKGFETKNMFTEEGKPKAVAQIAAAATPLGVKDGPKVGGVPTMKGILDRMGEEVKSITDLKAQEKQAAAQTPKVEAKIDLTDKRTIDIKNNLCVDGEEVSIARERHKQEIEERAGFKATPWQRRVAVQNGAAPLKGVA